MPKLPTIQSEEPLPRRSPYNGPDPDIAFAPMRALAAGAAQVGHTGQQVYAQGQELLNKQREAEDAVDAMQLRTRFGQELATLDGKLRMARDFDLSTHAETLTKEGNTLLEKIAGEAKRPEVANLLRQHGTQTLGARAIEAKYEYRTNLSGRIDAANLGLKRQVESEIVQAKLRGDETSAGFLANRYAALTAVIAGQGHITPEQASKRQLDLGEDVDTAMARYAMRADPDAFLAELDNPGTEENPRQYTNLTETRRVMLRDQAIKLAEHLAKQGPKDDIRFSGELKKVFVDRMDAGINVDTEIRDHAKFLVPPDYEHLIERNRKLQEGDRRSVSEVANRLELWIRKGGRDYGVVDREAKNLSVPDYRHLVGTIDAKLDEERKERKTDAEKVRDKQIQGGQAVLSRIFKTLSIMNFDHLATTVEGLALAEYDTRVATERNKNPNLIANEIIQQYAPALAERMLLDEGLGAILKYRSEAELKAAKAAGKLTDDTFLTQRRLLQHYEYIQETLKQPGMKAKLSEEKAKTRTTPFPGKQGLQ